jgi:hypothetical protein
LPLGTTASYGGIVAFYELPGWATGAAIAAAFWGLLMALALCIPVAAGALSGRRWPDVATGAMAAGGAIYLALYAGSQDTYFSNPIRRWDSFGHGGLVVGAVAVSALAVGALISARSLAARSARVRGAALFVAAVGFGLQLAGYLLLSIGH